MMVMGCCKSNPSTSSMVAEMTNWARDPFPFSSFPHPTPTHRFFASSLNLDQTTHQSKSWGSLELLRRTQNVTISCFWACSCAGDFPCVVSSPRILYFLGSFSEVVLWVHSLGLFHVIVPWICFLGPYPRFVWVRYLGCDGSWVFQRDRIRGVKLVLY